MPTQERKSGKCLLKQKVKLDVGISSHKVLVSPKKASLWEGSYFILSTPCRFYFNFVLLVTSQHFTIRMECDSWICTKIWQRSFSCLWLCCLKNKHPVLRVPALALWRQCRIIQLLYEYFISICPSKWVDVALYHGTSRQPVPSSFFKNKV